MKVSINWLKELVDLKHPIEEVIKLLPLRTIGLKDIKKQYLELDMKGYNRADLLSLRGIAYEVAAITNSEVKFNEEEDLKTGLPAVVVTVDDINLAPLYCIAKIENLKVEHSNETWVKKLNDSGVRSVNNVADITNLVMLEYGQPLHAFDASQVKDETIVVRVAKTGEKLTTLDGKIRDLTAPDLLITDPEKPLGLAGVMGGKNSEVSDHTSSILLEAAIFDPTTLRKTATKLGLISEASKRFYHGLTKKRLFQAFSSAIKMYDQLGGKLTGLTIVDNLTDKTITLDLTQVKINSLIGVKISSQEVEEFLKKLQFNIERNGQDWKVTPSYFRLDIEIEEDLIEEVARMYGYEKIPAKPLSGNVPNTGEDPIFGLLSRLKQALTGLGLTEVQTYSYYSTEVISNFQFPISNLVKIANPISAETEYLRDNLWPILVEVVAKNIRNGVKDVAIFEIGKVYREQKGLPQETYRLAIALSNETDNPINELYQIFKDLSPYLKDIKTSQLPGEQEVVDYFHPTRFVSLEKNGKNIGFIAEAHPRSVNNFGIEQRVAVLEIEITKLQ